MAAGMVSVAEPDRDRSLGADRIAGRDTVLVTVLVTVLEEADSGADRGAVLIAVLVAVLIAVMVAACGCLARVICVL